MDKLVVDPIGIKQHGLIYTSLSCIRNVSSLYLLHELHPKNFVVSNKVKNEMQRLENIANWKLECNIRYLQDSGYSVLCSLNTRSFSRHLDNIFAESDLMHSNFLCLQETRNTTNNMFSKFRNIFQHFCTNGPHGLVTFATNKSKMLKHHQYTAQHFESILLTLHFCNAIIHLANIYLAPMGPLEDLFSFILMTIDTCPPSAKLICTGDFNIDILQNSVRQRKLLDFMQSHQMFLLANKPTTDAGTLIDHFWSNMPSNTIHFNVLDTYWTDHHAIFLSFHSTT